jgi:hypothetical protein
MSSRSYRGFKTTVQRPPQQQILSRDDWAGSSAQASGSIDTVQPPSMYRPVLPTDTGYESPHFQHDT